MQLARHRSQQAAAWPFGSWPRASLARRQPALRAAKDAAAAKAVEIDGGDDPSPTTAEVAALLNTLVADTEIAELKLQSGSFALKVRRNVFSTPPSPAAAPAAVVVAPQPQLRPALSLAPAPYASMDDDGALDTVDEALVYVTANKVGVFRRGRYAAGKRIGKANCANQGEQIKKGQPLGYIEQLGTFVELKAPQAGEVVAFKADEGDAVEYGQEVVALSPYFGVEDVGKTTVRV